jgi:LysR family nitrogen assimilation transcriptional regulator
VELRQLRYFVRTVELGSVSKAAKHLFIAQPALSKHIGSLEAELKTRLLTRSVRGITPTEAGLTLYRHAQSVLRQLDRIPDEVRDASDSPSGVVAIGIPASTASILAAPLIRAVREKLPRVRLQISEGASGQLEELLASGRLEISLLYDRQKRAQKLHVRAILMEDLFLVSSSEEHCRDSAQATLSEVAAYPLILPSVLSTTRQLVDASFAKAGLSLNLLAEAESTSTMKSIAMAGLGAAILSRAALFPEDPQSGLRVRRIVQPALRRGLCLCTSHTAAVSRGVQAVMEVVQHTARQLIHDGVWRNVAELPAE